MSRQMMDKVGCCVEGSTIHPYRVTDFGVFLEDDAIDLSPGTVFISAKERTQAIPSDLISGAFDNKQSSTSVNIKSSAVQVESQRLPLEEVQRLNQVFIPSVSTENWGETQKLLLENIQQISIPIVNTENWGETNMADASPRTDISTDADTDDKNQRVLFFSCLFTILAFGFQHASLLLLDEFDGGQSTALMASDSSDRSKDKMDQKTLRRLAQNREAARKSRLRKKVAKENEEVRSVCKEEGTVCEKNFQMSLMSNLKMETTRQLKPVEKLEAIATDLPKMIEDASSNLGELKEEDPVVHSAYVQQLESSRLKLSQLEQELQRARQQGIFVSSSGDQSHSMSGNGAMAFDVEYARWLEEQNRQINELRSAVNSHAGDAELRIIIDGIMAHYDEVFKLKSNAAKADVFHLLSGMWKTPAERCFLWLGGFRSSELLKLLVNQLEPLTEQQLVGIGNLQQSSQQAEDALSQGMEALQQSLAETLSSGTLGSSGSSGNVANYMGQMAMAMGKLGTLEGFIRQADNLRQQTLQQMHRILTTRQSARALLAIHDYFSRLRALSSLWLARPRE
ncbi:hypothetical protein DKX38_000207 [Salix brachista]|uniref:DOG1 domain-containing protein n=1 Tax=Salix brachista TaxID=2182728 RepID=A0A5N5P1R4_9ROSI|nr:hypothetical protein DKX38_000207 [Salix brachista]